MKGITKNMREFDKLANEKFQGNVKETIHYLLFNKDGFKYTDYSDELTKKETAIALKYMMLSMQKAHGGKKEFNKALLQNKKLESLKMTKNEVLFAPENPFSRKLKKQLLLLLCVILLPLILVFIFKKIGVIHEVVYYCQAVCISILAVDLSNTFICHRRFSKLRRELTEPFSEIPEEEITIPVDALTDEEVDLIEDEECEITRSTLIRELKNIFKDKRNNGIALVIMSSIFIFCTCINILWLIPTVIWIVSTTIFLIKSIIKLNQTNNLNFRIVKDECISKIDKSEKDSWVSNHFLYFKKYGKHKIYNNGKIFYQDWTASTFKNTSVGDKFYLVLMGSGNHIALVFPEKDWKFIPEEFTVKNDVIYPKKDKSVNDIIAEKLENQKKTYSRLSLEKIQQAKELSKIYKKEILKYALFTLWGFLICCAVILITTATKNLPVAIILSIGLAALYILKTISLYKAMLKAQKALFFIPNEYAEYRKLNSSYHIKLLIVLLLTIINLFVTVISVPLSIAMVFHQ